MAYTKQTWADAPATTSPVTATRLAHIEDGVEEAHVIAESHSHAAGDITSGNLPVGRLTPGSSITVDKALAVYGAAGAWPTARPTSRGDVKVEWIGNTDPGTLALAGDTWEVTP